MTVTLESLARGIDAACEARDMEALRVYLETLSGLDRTGMSNAETASLNFFEANAHAGLRNCSDERSFDWIEPSLEAEILALRVARLALADESTLTLRNDLKLRIITNLANALDRCGRFVEAIELWDEVLAEHPRFGMAMGNKGLALYSYARYVGSGVEQEFLLRASHRSLKFALKVGVEPHAQAQMGDLIAHLEKVADWDKVEINLPPFRRGRSKRERDYRLWCVQHRAVLNSINDVEFDAEALHDAVVLPPITVAADDSSSIFPRPYAIFNQLKQEYVSARYVVFEALAERNENVHFADRGVVLFDALDYRYYRVWIEKLKMVFLSLHALFDKIAYLVNEYWQVEMEARRVSFSSVWHFGGRTKQDLSPRFQGSDNWPLRGLYCLSRDFHLKPAGEGAADPEAKVLNEIRNHIAHKYLRVHDHTLYDAAGDRARNGDELGYPISDRELVDQVMRLLKLARSALVGVQCAVAHEEVGRSREIGDRGLIFPMEMFEVGDKYRL